MTRDTDPLLNPDVSMTTIPWWQRYPVAVVVFLLYTVAFVSFYGIFVVIEWTRPFSRVNLYDDGPTVPATVEWARLAGVRTGCFLNFLVFTGYAVMFPPVAYRMFLDYFGVPGQSIVTALGCGGVVVSAAVLAITTLLFAQLFLEATVYGTRAERPLSRLLRGYTYRCLPSKRTGPFRQLRVRLSRWKGELL
jgi:hypothetical protein